MLKLSLLMICRNDADALAALKTARLAKEISLVPTLAIAPCVKVLSLLDNQGIKYSITMGSVGEIAMRLLLGTNDNEFFCLPLPGIIIPKFFLELASHAMKQDDGLAAYALVGSDEESTTWNSERVRKEISSDNEPVPQVLLFRKSILMQLDNDMDCMSMEDLNFNLLARLSRWFRTMVHTVKQDTKPLLHSEANKTYHIEAKNPFDLLLEDYVEYKGVKDARQTAYKHAVDENAKLFALSTRNIDINNKSKDALVAIGRYYENNDHYMDELAYWHCFRYWDGWWTFSRFIEGKFLEYGGGLGTMSAFAARQVSKIDYFDINRNMIDFVRFRINKRKLPINILPIKHAPNYHLSIKSEYDTICAIDVIEHIPNWQEATSHLIDKLRPGGTLIQHTNFGKTGTHPMHFDSQIKMSDWLKNKGMELIYGVYREYKGIVWRKSSN